MKQKAKEKAPLKILYLEDSPKDVEIIRELLDEAGFDLSMDYTDKKKEYTSLLKKNLYDLVLSDFQLPGFDAFGALEIIKEINPEIPFICVSGSIGEEIAIELIKKGAIDYVLKDRMVRLPAAIKHALQTIEEKRLRRQAEEALLENQKRFRTVFNASPVGTLISRFSDGKIIDANPAVKTLLGYDYSEVVGRTTTELGVWVDTVQRDLIEKEIKNKGMVHDIEAKCKRKNGEIGHLLVSAETIELSGQKYLLSLFHDISKRKKAEEALSENEERFRATFENANVGVCIVSLDGLIVKANEAMSKMFGYGCEELEHMTVIDITHQDDKDISLKFIQGAISGEVQNDSFDKRYMHKDGHIIWAHISSSLIRDHSGKPLYFISHIQDITKRRQAEEALRESEEKFRTFAEQSPNMIFINNKGRVVYANAQCEEIMGYSKEEFYSPDFSFLKITAPEYVDILKAFFKRHLNGEEVPPYEYSVLTKKGERLDVILTSKLIPYGNEKAILGIITDITDRKRTEKLLQENQETINAIVDTSQDWIWAIDTQGNHTYSNPAVEKILGYKPEEIFGMKDIDLLHNEDKEKVVSLKQTNRSTGWSNLVLRWRHKDGGYRYLESNAVPILDSKNKIVGFRGVDRDITERKEAEEALRESEEKFRNVIETALEGVWFLDSEFKTTEVNDAIVKMLGYTREEITGRPFNDFVVEEDRTAQKEEFERRRQGISGHYERRVRCKDGSIKWLFLSAKAQSNSEGKFIGTFAMITDITERKQMENALLESEANLKRAQTTAKLGSWIYDMSKGLSWSSEMYRIFGVSPETFILNTNSFISLIHPKDRSAMQEWIRACSAGEKPGELEFCTVHPDGTIRWISGCGELIFDSENKPVCISGTAQDITDRKRAEERHANLSHILEESLNEIYIISVEDLRFIEVNKGAQKNIGYSIEELRKMTPLDIKPEFTKQSYNELVTPLLTGERELIVFETIHRRKNGSDYRVEIHLQCSTYETKPVFVAIILDITERKRIEQALQESEKDYRELIDGMNETVWIIDFEGNLIDVNKTALQVLGYTKEELLNIGLFGVDSSLKREDIKSLAESMPVDKLQIFETTHKTKGGWSFPIEVYSSIVNYQGKKAILSIARDITERKKTEDLARQKEQQFKTLFMSLDDGFYLSEVIYDDYGNPCDYRYLETNPKFEQMPGLSHDQIVGKRYREIIPVDTTQWLDNYCKVARTGLPAAYSFYSPEFKKHFETYSYQTAKGLISVFVRDVTRRVLMEEQLRQIQKMEGLGTLAGGIAHDFNNILGIILAYNTGIKRFKDDPKKLEQATDTITKAVDRGKAIVQQILTFARKTETSFESVNVNEVVMEIMTMIYETFPKTLTYAQNFGKGMPFINADRSQLYQALLNLCVNARDAMSNGGLLTINTRVVPGASLSEKHTDVSDTNYVCIEVSDTGEGMSDDVKKRIFEPFFTTKGIGKGTGLGLAVVFGVVQTHKGFADVESELGKGTTFRLYIPAIQTAEPEIDKEEEKLEDIKGGTETLLVVEDEEMLIMSLQMALFEKGYNVLTASDGLEALKVYQENKNDISLVMTDLGLPGMTGLEVCQKIKQIKSNERVVLATGYLDPEMKTELVKAGIEHFLFKPYDLRKVLKTIRETLDRK